MDLFYCLENIDLAAQKIIEYLDKNDYINIVAFVGEMGSGKTTLIRSICNQWGVVNDVVSPSFSIINEYQTRKGIVYHFDFFRIKNVSEAIDIGTEDYFRSGNYCLIEWPQLVEQIFPQRFIKIEIEVVSENQRKLKITTNDTNQ